MKSQKVRNLLFDLGNVIVDLDIEGANEALNKLFRKDADKAAIDRLFIEFECGRVSTDIFIRSLLHQCHKTVKAIDIIEAWNSVLVGIPDYRLDMLQMLRNNFSVYLLSNTNALHLEWVHQYVRRTHSIDHFELDFFDQAYYSHLIGDRKPLASIFKHVIDDAFMIPALTLYMDDIKENIDTAEKLGFKTYLVKEGEEIAEFLKAEGYY